MFKYVAAGVLASTLVVTASGQDEKGEKTSDNGNLLQAVTQGNVVEAGAVTTTAYQKEIAKVWLAGLPDYQNKNVPNGFEINVKDVSGQAVNPNMPDASAKYPQGTKALYGSASIDGHVVYKENGDGTISVYDSPMHFSGPDWARADYNKTETQKIIDNPKVVTPYNGDEATISAYASTVK
ncbi:hypothetical protein CD149_01155 [Staphylococcus condimenti]|nr:hypothetical protein [Staphylococcus condimenti]OFO99853.1 hypothetical protein HMPREF3007_05725 [Staphylococcus sp. HMSC065E08]AMY06066.1 hypothetical protein A4G25_09075 [Staphylococcus condimenti]APR59944.1 hypothetical protein BTZ13_01470 [Staphylococcus condimenti]MDK8646170.1 hypothetical protein [Staphylococcus condimenti]PNZ64015.1 hypothetical protein CD149_01155 [Staphylococcus condimenti]